MTRLVIGALLVLAAQTGWAFNGCPPASDDADKCETGIVKALGKFGGAVINCHAEQADGAFKQKPVDEETCEEAGPKSAKGKFDATVAQTAPKCPPEVVTNAGTVSAELVSGSGSLDVQNGLVYCDTSSGTPIDPSGDDAGSVPSSADGLKCSDGVGKDLAKLWGAIGKCSTEAADAAFKGKAFDEATCRSTATGKYDAAAAKLIAKGGCPTCLDAGAQSALRDALLTQLDAIDGQIFVCPAPTTTTTTVTLPTTTTTTSLPGSTTTTSTTTTTLATTTTTTSTTTPSSTTPTSTTLATTTTSTPTPSSTTLPTTTSTSTTSTSTTLATTTTTSTTTTSTVSGAGLCLDASNQATGPACTSTNDCPRDLRPTPNCDPTTHPELCPTFGCCGDGTRDIGETCDKGTANCSVGNLCASDCSSNCQAIGRCTGSGTQCLLAADCPAGQGCCGNAIVEGPAETCDDGNFVDRDSCPAGCFIASCTPLLATSFGAHVTYTKPAGTTLSGLGFFVDYPEGKVTSPTTTAPFGVSNDVNQLGYGFTVEAVKLGGLPSPLLTITFQTCQGASAATAADFKCKVTDASDDLGNVVDPATVTCAVTVP